MSRQHGPKWSDIPRPINGQAYVDLIDSLQQYAPSAFPAIQDIDRYAQAHPEIVGMLKGQGYDLGDVKRRYRQSQDAKR